MTEPTNRLSDDLYAASVTAIRELYPTLTDDELARMFSEAEWGELEWTEEDGARRTISLRLPVRQPVVDIDITVPVGNGEDA